jgi:hypothetical protein
MQSLWFVRSWTPGSWAWTKDVQELGCSYKSTYSNQGTKSAPDNPGVGLLLCKEIHKWQVRLNTTYKVLELSLKSTARQVTFLFGIDCSFVKLIKGAHSMIFDWIFINPSLIARTAPPIMNLDLLTLFSKTPFTPWDIPWRHFASILQYWAKWSQDDSTKPSGNWWWSRRPFDLLRLVPLGPFANTRAKPLLFRKNLRRGSFFLCLSLLWDKC